MMLHSISVIIKKIIYLLCLLFRSIKEGGKRSVFLTNTVTLAHQQAEVISKSTPLKVAVYTGDMNVDTWKNDRWNSEFENNQVNSFFIFHLMSCLLKNNFINFDLCCSRL